MHIPGSKISWWQLMVQRIDDADTDGCWSMMYESKEGGGGEAKCKYKFEFEMINKIKNKSNNCQQDVFTYQKTRILQDSPVPNRPPSRGNASASVPALGHHPVPCRRDRTLARYPHPTRQILWLPPDKQREANVKYRYKSNITWTQSKHVHERFEKG